MLTTSEAGLYSFIFRSHKPEARAFRKWVTGEVLPAVRKSGHYAVPQMRFIGKPITMKAHRLHKRSTVTSKLS